MPNHFHAVLGIQKDPPSRDEAVPHLTTQIDKARKGGMPHLSSQNTNIRDEATPRLYRRKYSKKDPNEPINLRMQKISPVSDSSAAIIGQFKSVCTKRIRQGLGLNFQWQPNYWDRIIRDNEELNRISEYIQNNPKSWETDSINPKNYGIAIKKQQKK